MRRARAKPSSIRPFPVPSSLIVEPSRCGGWPNKILSLVIIIIIVIFIFISLLFSLLPVLAGSLGALGSGSGFYSFTTHGPRLGSHDGSSAIAQSRWTTTTSSGTHHNGHCHRLQCATATCFSAASPASLRGQHRSCGLKATSLCALLWWWRRPAAAVVVVVVVVGSCARIAAPSAPHSFSRSRFLLRRRCAGAEKTTIYYDRRRLAPPSSSPRPSPWPSRRQRSFAASSSPPSPSPSPSSPRRSTTATNGLPLSNHA